MPNPLLIDNWTLQCASQVLDEGLRGGEATELDVAPDWSGFSYRRVSEDVVNARCLFQVLSQVVLADELLVDDGSVHTWNTCAHLTPLAAAGIVVPKPFQAIRPDWLPARERFVAELCIGEAMVEQHERNELLFKEGGENEDEFFAQLIWGGAGMLARAHALRLPYVAHPLRESWFRRVDMLFGPRAAPARLQDFITEQRVKVLRRVDTSGYLVRLNLPPLAALIVEEARSPADFLPIALQLRDAYRPLRRWLGEFQAALDAGRVTDVLEHDKLLQSVASHIEACISASPVGETTLQIGLSWLRFTGKTGDPLNSMQNQFGVRAMLHNLILAPPGHVVLTKFRRLFGELHTRAGVEFEQAFGRREFLG